MAQLLQNESESDYDEGKDIAEWKQICEEQGIDVTSLGRRARRTIRSR